LLKGHADEIVFADRGDLNGVGEFECSGVGMRVRGYDLFGGFGAAERWLVVEGNALEDAHRVGTTLARNSTILIA
jgi:hypothetical protein